MSADPAAPFRRSLAAVPAAATAKSVRLVAPLPAPLSLRTERRTPARNGSIDALRIAAILAVITIHTVSPLTAAAVVPRYSPSWWLGTTWNVSSLWCVPVFVMISGSLVLSKPIESTVG
ncbi:MAG: acyltransferase family protein, partial [Frankiaceae bacterium]|nr:acyltransferase family protein [Frankiaceae bacterium]